MSRRRKEEAARLRDARRESLAVLLARMQRGVLSPAEAGLLRVHVEAEMESARQAHATAAGAQTAAKQMRDRLDAADAAIVEAEHDRDQAAKHLAGYVAVFGPNAVDDFHVMQHRAKQAEELSRAAHQCSNAAEAERARQYERAEQAIRRAGEEYDRRQAAEQAAAVEADRLTEHLAAARRRGDAWKRRALAAEHRADRYRTAWFAARRDRKADRAAMAAELPFVQAGQRILAAAQPTAAEAIDRPRRWGLAGARTVDLLAECLPPKPASA